LISGSFESNRRLIEERLAEDMATSRTPVREAIQKLEKEGLIYRPLPGGLCMMMSSSPKEEVDEILGLRSRPRRVCPVISLPPGWGPGALKGP